MNNPISRSDTIFTVTIERSETSQGGSKVVTAGKTMSGKFGSK